MDPDAVAKAFVEHYYTTFDANRTGLANLYQEAFLSSSASTPSPPSIASHPVLPGGMLVFVSGNLQLAGEQHALKFSQMFHLMPTPQGSFYVLNDIFRLNYA
ncbi:hypothetical protein Patl1_16959 [Pistacia atlantica]|uniref:Uncharacterized protein n=1 Tax=Pistacia atlantica TaxID=434234 RepID=A0ACC1B9P4_9ROSI|nr:hypothetical protein Patl1_16959 [Pistacia atlantica]